MEILDEFASPARRLPARPAPLKGGAMPAAEDAFIDLMKEADAAAWRKSHALPSKITTSIYYTARKAIVTAPSKGASFLASHIPIVGAIAAFGAGKLTDKIRKARVAAKVFAAEGRDREEVSPQDVKALAKAIADRAKKMDENFTKLSDAWGALRTATTSLDTLARAPRTTAQAWTTGFWNAAYAYGRVDHYNVKLAEMIDRTDAQMEVLGKFAEDSNKALIDGKADLQTMFVAAYDSLITDSTPLLGRTSSSSSFSL